MRNQIVSRETTTGLWCEARAHLSVVFDSNKIFLETINGVLIAICIFCTIRTFQRGVVILVTNPAVVCIQLRFEACNFFCEGDNGCKWQIHFHRPLVYQQTRISVVTSFYRHRQNCKKCSSQNVMQCHCIWLEC